MMTRWVYLFRGPWIRGVVKHSIALAACLLAIYTQTLFRVPSRFLFVLIPYVSGALVFLSVVLLVNHLLRGVRDDDPARAVFQVAERISGVCVRVFVLYSVFLFANAALDRAGSEPREADVVEIAGDSLDLGHLPFRWIALRPAGDLGRVERVLLSPLDPPLWAGEPVLLDVRPGFFRLPWIARISSDDVRQARAILERNPTSAQGWKMLIKGYALRNKVAEGADATVEYARLYPADYDLPEAIAKGLGMAGHCPEMYRVLEPFIPRRTDYEFYVYVGHALACIKRSPEALAFLEKARELEPENWWADYEIGYLYFDAQKFELAQPFLARVQKTRNIASVARDLDTIEKILSLKRAREGGRK
jgi:tetratricopeptide (TPR) repeat protein